MTQYWLIKSEPDAFSWDQQVKNRVEPWTGVRNHMAKNNLKAMQKGDLAFFYHSNVGKEIVGIVKVARAAYPDPSAESGDWVCVDMQAVQPLPKPVTLATIKADPRFRELGLVRLSRLSVSPVSAEHWAMLCEMGGVR
jgi:predicted RNA-binding protein with PUA-like domain